ncbi:MAG: hypothetical protein MJ081_01705 [Ruminococcus sp.]|nr:hypothetical protein [Ruminococcus sp.]
MRNSKLTALAVAGVMAAASLVSCGQRNTESKTTETERPTQATNVYSQDYEIGAIEHKAEISSEVEANDTGYTLNAVYTYDVKEENVKYVYLDVTVKNPTDVEYEISVLNNFYIQLTDGQEVYSSVRTQLFGISNFNNFFSDPFKIPANGEFNGIVGGFIVDPSVDTFTVGFFPTKDNERNKENVVLIDVTPDLIKDGTELLK